MTHPVRSILLAAALLAISGSPALAFKEFYDQWVELYITEETDKDFSKHVTTQAKCYVCHQGRKKSNHNPYGLHLVELLGKGDRKDVEKIVAAIKEVGELHSVKDDDSSPTYAEVISENKLPGGTLDDAKEEPSS